MAKDFLVEFTNEGVRIHKDPRIIKAKKSLPNTVLNPAMGSVKGVVPSQWKLENGFIVPMTRKEIARGRSDISEIERLDLLNERNAVPENTQLPKGLWWLAFGTALFLLFKLVKGL